MLTEHHSHLDSRKKDTVNVASTTGKKWDKRHACRYCQKTEKTVYKMSSHLQRVHSLEPEVIAVLQLPKNSKERRQAFIQLQDDGDYKHNYNVLQENSGTLIPKYIGKLDAVLMIWWLVSIVKDFLNGLCSVNIFIHVL